MAFKTGPVGGQGRGKKEREYIRIAKGDLEQPEEGGMNVKRRGEFKVNQKKNPRRRVNKEYLIKGKNQG